jgi:rare lipoprotein A
VELERITFAEIRSGAWRRDAAPTVVARAPAAEAVPANAAPAVAVAAAPLDVAPPPMAPPEPEVDGAPLRPPGQRTARLLDPARRLPPA